MRVIVTGGAGFLGASVVKELKSRGHEPRVFDISQSRESMQIRDIRDASAVMEFCEGADAVIHLAGVLGTAELFARPEFAIDVNVHGALNVLQACRKHGLRYVGIAMPECWPNVYQATKLCAMRLASAWHQAFGIPVSHVRAFNAYGSAQKYGHGHPQKIVPTFATLAWQGKPIPIWGDGNQKVDLIHTDDIARMMVSALAFGDDRVFDAGTGVPMTVNQVAQMILDITLSTSEIEYLPMRAGETPTEVTYARGDGWDVMDRPVFDRDRFEACVRSYQAGALGVGESAA